MRVLYELSSRDGYSYSLFVFKVRAVLGYKKLEYESVVLGFKEIHEQVAKYNPKKEVPVLIDGDKIVCDSDLIYEYLEENYPQSPVRKGDTTVLNEIMQITHVMLSIGMPNTVAKLKDEDQEYFRAKAEAATGRKVEESLKDDVYQENLSKWRSTIDSLTERIVNDSQVTFSNINIAGVLYWLRFCVGADDVFGDNENLKSWFENFLKVVHVD
ncbi:glutathione S-transferase [Acrasis kona]|uniref:Glutathione S-transferase n=1 Tax=Acrasis kona TaxID=1008807 RepID=A0AAW2Z4I1_9EUKA